jgi:hypothetical protein
MQIACLHRKKVKNMTDRYGQNVKVFFDDAEECRTPTKGTIGLLLTHSNKVRWFQTPDDFISDFCGLYCVSSF